MPSRSRSHFLTSAFASRDASTYPQLIPPRTRNAYLGPPVAAFQLHVPRPNRIETSIQLTK